MSDMYRRLHRLELIWPKPSCPVCRGKPSRLVVIDPDTDEEVSANMPETGCLTCGTLVFREYRVVTDESPGT